MQSGIYMITNAVNGKIYVGSSSEIGTRKRRHFSHLDQGKHHNSHLQHAYNANGSAAFTFTVIEYCEPEQLVKREAWWIELLGAKDQGRGYNYYDPVTGSRGIKHTEAARAKMVAARRGQPNNWVGRKHTPETRQKMAIAHLGQTPTNLAQLQSEECRRKMAAARKGQKLSPEHKAKISARLKGRKGKPLTAASIAKMAATKKGKPWSEARRAVYKPRTPWNKGITGVQKGHKQSPETRQRISEAAKGRVITAERRAHLSAINKGKPWSEARRAASLKSKQPAPIHAAAPDGRTGDGQWPHSAED